MASPRGIRNATIPIAQLKAHPRNYRSHPERQLGRLSASLARFGQVRSIVVQEGAGGRYLLVAGHGLAEAAKREGMKELRADIIPADWTPEQVEGYLVADNMSGADDDAALLAEILQEQANAGYDLESLGYDAGELDALLEELTQNALSGAQHDVDDPSGGGDDFDTTPDESGPTRVQPGDIWTLGEHRLLCGDSTKREDVARLMDGERADMMWTDPPYGVDYVGGDMNARHRERLANDADASVYKRFLPVVLPFVDGPCYMWFAGSKGGEVYDALSESRCEVHALLIWNKTNATYAALNANYKQRHEPFMYFKPRGLTLRWAGPTTECSIWDLPRDPRNDMHPTQKPLALPLRAIKNHDADSVLDVFAGSGVALIAAERLERRCYAIEISPRYCDVILRRWEAETGREATLLARTAQEEVSDGAA